MKIINTLFLSLLPVITFAQSIISGKIIDDRNSPIPFCNVILIDPSDNNNYGGGTTDDEGYFQIQTDILGKYAPTTNCAPATAVSLLDLVGS